MEHPEMQSVADSGTAPDVCELNPTIVVEKLRAGESVRHNGRFLVHDEDDKWVWGTDEYGCDCVPATSQGDGDPYLERAAAWLFHVRDIPHPLERGFLEGNLLADWNPLA
ncbi:hypothetical protein JN531_017105 (plasmid) [Flagellatimonas centrodinii]|uniref:hypothetical protein n=1 Tax=Flagellatimonas centrodinii TaxID=2806210 RepID=UPI001FEFA8E4|nr:hypothetical protein [Flagellatimonas centrodinii]ULQ48352.1 hypothetical protein JN531_017105 [Flagellatimonas centrodinii]